MHCGICGAQESIEQKSVDAEDTTTRMEFQMRVVFCVECGIFGIGFDPVSAMLDFGKPRGKSLAPDWVLPPEWLLPKDGKYSEAARRVIGRVD
ncbi:hypothetical protein LCGC14_0258380 [marine sediment metagenome]|uniref:Uncharacterized protein n=1 Tax=marine sediment metagenome TaxID=412755 RepID=A0A0F9X741_9ZZZZ